MYTKMMGYDVDFGHKQAMDMMAATTFAEKQVGYIVCAMFLCENDALLRLVINSVRSDILSRNEAFQCLALEFTANGMCCHFSQLYFCSHIHDVFAVGGAEFAQLLASDVLGVMAHGATRPLVRKKAAFCLLRMFRKNLNDSLIAADEWGTKLATLLEETDLGVLLGLTSLLLGIVSRNFEGYEPCVPKLIDIMERLRERDVPQDYTYYGIPTPWLQVKILRTLQYFPAPENPHVLDTLRSILRDILKGNGSVKNLNKNNAVNAIFFEAAGVAVSIGDEELTSLVVDLMVGFLSARESNLRYLALENLSRLSQSFYISEAIGKHRKAIIKCMSDADTSITGGSLNLLFTTASQETAPEIVDELLLLLERADYSLREELALKAAILAERFPVSADWYVSTMLKLILCAGDATSNEIWHSVLHLVSSKADLHNLAANKVMSFLHDDVVNQSFLKCAAYIIGEYGGNEQVEKQFRALHRYYPTSSARTRAMILNCYEKMRYRSPNSGIVAEIDNLMNVESRSIDAEVQQRANEYKVLGSNPEASTIAMQTLPTWELKNSVLLRKLAGSDSYPDEFREQPSWMSSTDISLQGEDSSGGNSQIDVQVAEPNVNVVPEPAALVDLLSFEEDIPTADEKKSSNMAVIENLVIENPLFLDEKPKPSSVEPIGDLESWRVSLFSSLSGILYEDLNLQIGMKMRSNGPNLEADFYLGNKSKGTIDIKKLGISPSSYFDVSCGTPPSIIHAGEQLLFNSAWTCLLPSDSLPELQIQYINSTGESLARSLELPVTCTKFCKPVTIPQEMFVKRWNQVSAAPFKRSEDLQLKGKVELSQLRSLLESVNMELIHVDLGSPAICAVSVFHCEAGKLKQIPCMVSLFYDTEVDDALRAKSLRLSVATADALVSGSLTNVLKSLIVAM